MAEDRDERIEDVPNDFKMMISKVAALHSCATEPGQILILTLSLKRWVQAGIVKRFGGIPPSHEEEIIACKKRLDQAILNYTNSQENWGEAIILCSEVADDLVEIATLEDLLDYTTIEANMMMIQPVEASEREITLDDQRLMPGEIPHGP